MEKVAEKILNPYAAITQRAQKISALRERLSSDETWQPPCASCEPSISVMKEQRGLILVEDLRIECPKFADGCRAHTELAADLKRKRQLDMNQWFAEVGIGSRYWNTSREGIREAKEIICEYLDNIRERAKSGKGVLFVGPKGTGKSQALALIGRTLYEDAAPSSAVRFMTVTQLMMELCQNKKDAYWNGRVLLLDEFGAAFESDYAFALFEDYLNWRYERVLATCVAANLTKDQLTGNPAYTRIVDRWRETNTMIVMAGDSQRKERR